MSDFIYECPREGTVAAAIADAVVTVGPVDAQAYASTSASSDSAASSSAVVRSS